MLSTRGHGKGPSEAWTWGRGEDAAHAQNLKARDTQHQAKPTRVSKFTIASFRRVVRPESTPYKPLNPQWPRGLGDAVPRPRAPAPGSTPKPLIPKALRTSQPQPGDRLLFTGPVGAPRKLESSQSLSPPTTTQPASPPSLARGHVLAVRVPPGECHSGHRGPSHHHAQDTRRKRDHSRGLSPETAF